MKDIVITAGTATGSVLALAEAITSKVKCSVYVLCTNKSICKIFTSSRFVTIAVYINAPDEKGYITEIKNWYKKTKFEHKPILYFTTDVSCFYIDNYREWFESNFELCLPSSNIIRTFTQKGLAELKAHEAGLSIPKTIVINDKNDIDTIISEFKFPIILKPRATYLKEGIDFKIKVFENKKDFLSFYARFIENKNSLLCQEFVPGGNDSSYYYIFYRDNNGRVFENIGRKTLQSTVNGGIMLKGVTKYDANLSELCKNFLNIIDYKGIGGIEFKKYNGKFYFIEMSVRLEGFYKICESSKSSLSLISYYDKAGLTIPNNYNNATQVDNIVYVDIISTLITNLKNKETLNFLKNISEPILNPTIAINTLSIKDPLPFIKRINLALFRK